MSRTGSDLAVLGERRIVEIVRQLEEVNAEKHRFKHRRAALFAEAQRADAELGAALLPELTAASYLALNATTGYDAFLREDPARAREQERQKLLARQAALRADPRYPGLQERLGDVLRQIHDLETERDPARRIVEDAQHERLKHLLDVSYGTAEYAVPFWRMSYYSDWKAGDELLERFPEYGEDFGRLRSAYFQARATELRCDEKLDPLRQQRASLMEVKTQLDEVESILSTLDERALGAARKKVIDWLRTDEPARARLERSPELASRLKRLFGLEHKLRYLDGLAAEQLDKLWRALDDERHALHRDVEKWRRPKRYHLPFPDELYQKRFVDRPRKRWAQLDRYRRGHETIFGFSAYDAVPLVGAVLWWDVMTDGRFDGDFLDEVSAFRQAHPGYAWQRNQQSEAAAAAAVANEQQKKRRRDEEEDVS